MPLAIPCISYAIMYIKVKPISEAYTKCTDFMTFNCMPTGLTQDTGYVCFLFV